MSARWTFLQTEGPQSARKQLELDGWNAPFGRPRQEPVIREVIKSRIQTTRYPGSSKQTRHAFGTNWESIDLKGRWMTKANTSGKTANEVAEDWTDFVKDERSCRIAWGFIVSYTGYIEELELARESEHEIAWRMKIEIDNRDDVSIKNKQLSFAPPADDNIAFLASWRNTGIKQLEPAIPDMSPDFLESLDNLAAALNQPSAEFNKLAGRFGDLEKATYSTLQHFRGAVTGFRTAVLNIRETVLNADIDTVMLVRTADSDLAWLKYQLDLDYQTYLVMDQLNQLDRKAELAEKQEVSKFVTAIQGDTWESISIRATGGPDKAGEIRQINGIRYGYLPLVGTSYLVL